MAEPAVPRASLEYTARSIATGSASSAGSRAAMLLWDAPCSRQYWMTMAIDAGPQPFLVCLTNGTSSHTRPGSRPPGSALPGGVERQKNTACSRLKDQDDDQRCRERDDDVGDLEIGESARRDVLLDLVGLGSQARQFVVVQGGRRLLDFGGIDLGGLQSLLGGVLREELLDLGQVLLPGLGSALDGLVKFGRRHDVRVLSGQSQREQERENER